MNGIKTGKTLPEKSSSTWEQIKNKTLKEIFREGLVYESGKNNWEFDADGIPTLLYSSHLLSLRKNCVEQANLLLRETDDGHDGRTVSLELFERIKVLADIALSIDAAGYRLDDKPEYHTPQQLEWMRMENETLEDLALEGVIRADVTHIWSLSDPYGLLSYDLLLTGFRNNCARQAYWLLGMTELGFQEDTRIQTLGKIKILTDIVLAIDAAGYRPDSV